MTRPEARYLRKAIDRELKAETDLRIVLAKVAGGSKLVGG